MTEKKIRLLNDLPIIPEIAMKVMNIAEDGMEMSFRELENIIKVDPGLTSKILRVANSALYARQKEVKNLQTAITLLGFKNIKSLVLLLTASSLFHKVKQTDYYKKFWKHTIITAFLAKALAVKCNKKEVGENAFISGLLHKIGKVIIFSGDQEGYLELLEKEGKEAGWIEELEEEYYGINHRSAGAELFKKWNFPDLFIDVAGEHDSLNITSPYKTIIIFVTIASIMAEKFGYGVYTGAKEELLEKLLLHTTLSNEDLPDYEKNYKEILSRDPLFIECQTLMGIA